MERALRAIDDLFTLRGTIAPRAQDIAYLASLPQLENEVMKYRFVYLANSLLGVSLSGAKTWGAFNLEQNGGYVYAGGRLGQAVKGAVWPSVRFNWYEKVFEPAQQNFFAIPPEIRTKLDEHLILGGIPEFQVFPSAVTHIIYGARNQMYAVDLACGAALPTINVLAAGEKVPGLAKLGILAVAYTSLLCGPLMANWAEKTNFEWNLTQTMTKTGRESNGTGKNRLEIGTKWVKENLSRFAKHYLLEGSLLRLGDVLSGIAVILNNHNAFGLVNMVDGAMGGFSDLYNTISDLTMAKRDAKIIKLAREFCELGIFLPTEGSWDAYRQNKFESLITDPLDDDAVCRFDRFRTEIEGKIGPEINGTLNRGHLHLVEGASGDGKTTFLFALRGLVQSHGNVIFHSSEGQSISIYGLNHDQLRHKITYYSPDESKGKGYRIVDMYTDEFLRLNPAVLEQKWMARALSVDDALLDRYLTGNIEISWEKGIFDVLSDEEQQQIRILRQERIDFANTRIHELGQNMGELSADKSLSELSSGMRERVMLDRVLLALDKGTEVLVLDEPLGRVDPDTARHLIREICQRLEKIPAERRPAIVLVSNVHKQEIREEAEKILGVEKISTLDVHKS